MSRATTAAWSVLTLWVVVSLLAPLAVERANDAQLDQILTPPGTAAWLGTDDLGRSLGARLALGARLSLSIALLVVSVCALVGITLGVAAAWLGGWFELVVVRLIDIFLAFPGLLLAIALAGILGPSMFNLTLSQIGRAHV